MNNTQMLKYDQRVRARVLAKGLISGDELAAHLESLPDRGGVCESVHLPQPGFSGASSAEPAPAPVPVAAPSPVLEPSVRPVAAPSPVLEPSVHPVAAPSPVLEPRVEVVPSSVSGGSPSPAPGGAPAPVEVAASQPPEAVRLPVPDASPVTQPSAVDRSAGLPEPPPGLIIPNTDGRGSQ